MKSTNKTLETNIREFWGIANDPRTTDNRYARMIAHFDLTDRHRLIPYRSVEDGDSSSSSNMITRYLYGNSRIYGLSTASGTSQKLFSRTDLTGAVWDTPSNTNVAGVPNGKLFVDYPRVGKLFWSLSAAVASFKYSDSTYAASASAITATAQGLVHSDDNVLYVPCTNVIAKNDNDSWNTSALTLPSEYTITSLFEYGVDLGIACKPASGFGRSKIFLWDKTSTSWHRVIDWGEENLELADIVSGALVGISTKINSSSFKGRIIFRDYTGGESANEPFLQLVSSTSVTSQTLWKQKAGDRLYFNLFITLDSVFWGGVWALYRPGRGQSLALTLDRLYRNDALNSSDVIQGFYIHDDYAFISYTDGAASNAWKTSKTDDSNNFSITSVYESLILTGGDSSVVRKLVCATVTHEPLPSSGVVNLKHKGDAETSYTSVQQNSENDSLSFTAVNMDTDLDGDVDTSTLPENAERQLRIESTGGAVITGVTLEERQLPGK